MAMGNNPVNLVDPSGGMDGDPKLGDLNEQGQVFTSDGWVTPLGGVTVFAPKEFRPTQMPIAQDAVRFVLDSHPVSDELHRFLDRKRGGLHLYSNENGTGEIDSDGIADRSGNIDILDDLGLIGSDIVDFFKAFKNIFGTEHEKVHQPKPSTRDIIVTDGPHRFQIGNHIELGSYNIRQTIDSAGRIIKSDTNILLYKNLGKR